MARMALLGAAIAGPYGALHDQISYIISPEYFTKMKFRQFSYADFGWPDRVFAAEVGFLATSWVGLFGGWFVARAGLAGMPKGMRWSCFRSVSDCAHGGGNHRFARGTYWSCFHSMERSGLVARFQAGAGSSGFTRICDRLLLAPWQLPRRVVGAGACHRLRPKAGPMAFVERRITSARRSPELTK